MRTVAARSRPVDAGAERLGLAIKRAEQVLIAEKTRVLRPFGLTVPQYAAMVAIAATPGISGARAARQCHVTPQTMAVVLAALEAKGLIERQPSDDHAQVLVTRLTRVGHALFRRADAAALAVEERLAAAFSDTELVTLRELLVRAAEAIPAPAAAG
ncbi:MarR family transcriptional regulator [Frankia sp. ACN1ag]|nr:MarR family transcriptional regulator [Frankia sp. ACN1ag]